MRRSIPGGPRVSYWSPPICSAGQRNNDEGTDMNPMLRNGRFTAMSFAAICALAAPALAQKDKMTPVPTPAQPNAIEIGTPPLPGATAKESWHKQYGSLFARNVTV